MDGEIDVSRDVEEGEIRGFVDCCRGRSGGFERRGREDKRGAEGYERKVNCCDYGRELKDKAHLLVEHQSEKAMFSGTYWQRYHGHSPLQSNQCYSPMTAISQWSFMKSDRRVTLTCVIIWQKPCRQT